LYFVKEENPSREILHFEEIALIKKVLHYRIGKNEMINSTETIINAAYIAFQLIKRKTQWHDEH